MRSSAREPSHAASVKLEEFNINDYVSVKLNDAGREILRQDHEAFRRMVPNTRAFVPPEEDEDGFSRFQLWDLMHKFGPHISLGRIPPFETTIRFSSAKPAADPKSREEQ